MMSSSNPFAIERLLGLSSTSKPTTIDLTQNLPSRKRSYDRFSAGESIESDKESVDEG